MTLPVKNDGTWNMYRDIVQQSDELEEDLRKLHRILASAEGCYDEIYDRYCDLPGWELLHAQVSLALGGPEILLGVMPGEAEKP